MQMVPVMSEVQRQHLEHKLRLQRIQKAADRFQARKRAEAQRAAAAAPVVASPTMAALPTMKVPTAVVPANPMAFFEKTFWFTDLISDAPRKPKRPKVADIQRVVAEAYSTTVTDIISARRTASVVRPRQVAMFLARTLTLKSMPELGHHFGGRDHTTILHAVRKIADLIDHDKALAAEIADLSAKLTGVRA